MDRDALCVEFFHLSYAWVPFGLLSRRNGEILYTSKSSYLIVIPNSSLSQRLQEAWRVGMKRPAGVDSITTLPACSLPKMSLYEVTSEGQAVIRGSVMDVLGVKDGTLHIVITDGTAECEVEVEESCLKLFGEMESLCALVCNGNGT